MNSGQKLTIEAVIAGRPYPVSYWMRNGAEVEENKNLLIQKLSQSTSLIIPRPTRFNSDEYIVRAENIHGNRQAIVNVIVLGM